MFKSLIFLLINFVTVSSNDHENFIPLVNYRIEDVQKYLYFTGCVLAICLIKVLYMWAKTLSRVIPESNMLVVVGIVIGLLKNMLWKNNDKSSTTIDSNWFFYILLPPIILEASFAMYHKTFISNIVGVLVFAVIATLLNFFFIALGLTMIYQVKAMHFTTPNVNVSTFWVFSSLIVAVDPVAVLAIFQEIHVDNNLYYLVFGESLLNDGVSVVLYEVMIILSRFEKITITDIGRTILSFFFVCIGGGLIGCFISVITCLITRFTFKTPLTEPILVLFFGYISYLVASMIQWSGIISMIVYGVFQATYGFQNITQKSLILIKRLAKILSNISEAVIFISLGISVTNPGMIAFTSFTCWSLFLCFYGRFIFTLLLSGIINYFDFNVRKIAWNEQFIIAYGGLRGGIAFCLSFLLHNSDPINVIDIQKTTVFIIFFTIFFIGMTMKPLVKLLNIQIAKPDQLCLFVQISESAIEHLLAGIEEIIGMKGRNSLHEFLAHIDQAYIKRFLQRDPLGREEKIMKVFEKMNLTMHMATTAPAGTQMSDYYLKKLKPHLRNYTIENFTRPDATISHRISTNPKTFNMDDTTHDNTERKHVNIGDLSTFNNIFAPRRSSEIHMDHSKLANRMSAMLYRRRRSLAVTNTDKPRRRLSRSNNDSETDMFTIEVKRKKDV